MRIEELSNNNFVKLPSQLEKSIINTMNRYFNSNPDFIKGSVEEILTEFAKRIKPMITSICKGALISEKDKLVTREFTMAMEKNKEKLINEIMDIVQNLKKEVIKPKTLIFTIENEQNNIFIPSEYTVYDEYNNIKVFVNGILQIKDRHYTVTKNEKQKVKEITFKNTLVERDTVSLEYFDIKIPKGDDKANAES